MRIIAKIDYKNGYVIKGRRYEGFRKVGPVREIVDQYYNAGVREFTFYDCVAALFGMSKMLDQVVELSQRIFAHTAGGLEILAKHKVFLKMEARPDRNKHNVI